MIRLNLEIQDPSRSDSAKLLALAALFTSLAQGDKADQTRAALEDKVGGRVVGAPSGTVHAVPLASHAQLDPADNPAAGIPSPSEAFGKTESAETATGQIDRVQLEQAVAAATLPDPAAVFAGNAQGAPSGTPSGMPPAPSSGAQTAGASTPASTPSGVEVDAEGLPWDATINALGADGGHPKTTDGKWKKKRGVGETYLNERKAMLRAAMAAGNGAAGGAAVTPPANVPVPPPAGAGAPVPPPPPMTPPTTSTPGNVTPTPQVSPPTTNGAAGSSPVTLAQVLPRVTAAMAAGFLTPDSSAAIVREISDGKIDNVAMLAVAPALVPALVARLDALGIPA